MHSKQLRKAIPSFWLKVFIEDLESSLAKRFYIGSYFHHWGSKTKLPEVIKKKKCAVAVDLWKGVSVFGRMYSPSACGPQKTWGI